MKTESISRIFLCVDIFSESKILIFHILIQVNLALMNKEFVDVTIFCAQQQDQQNNSGFGNEILETPAITNWSFDAHKVLFLLYNVEKIEINLSYFLYYLLCVKKNLKLPLEKLIFVIFSLLRKGSKSIFFPYFRVKNN